MFNLYVDIDARSMTPSRNTRSYFGAYHRPPDGHFFSSVGQGSVPRGHLFSITWHLLEKRLDGHNTTSKYIGINIDVEIFRNTDINKPGGTTQKSEVRLRCF